MCIYYLCASVSILIVFTTYVYLLPICVCYLCVVVTMYVYFLSKCIFYKCPFTIYVYLLDMCIYELQFLLSVSLFLYACVTDLCYLKLQVKIKLGNSNQNISEKHLD